MFYLIGNLWYGVIMDITIDFETRATIDLKTHGAYVYAVHPETEIMCLAFQVEDERPRIWVPDKFLKMLEPLTLNYEFASDRLTYKTILSADRIIAHNSMFELLMWNSILHKRFKWPDLPLDLLYDTMSMCAYHALPLALGKAGEALNLQVQKNQLGHTTMMKMCKPRKPLKKEREKLANDGVDFLEDGSFYHPESDSHFHLWHETAEQMQILFNYGCDDVKTERLLFTTLPQLPDKEREIWLMDQRINLRGVPVDIENIKPIIETVADRKAEKLAEFQKLTKGAVTGPQSYVALREWVNEQAKLKVKSVDKDATNAILDLPGIPDNVRKVLLIKSELSKSSVSKLKAMVDRSSSDGRFRGMAQYHGASTGRWSARGVQMHNLPRDSYGEEDWEQTNRYIVEGDLDALTMLYDDIYYVASRCVRGSIKAQEGYEFLCADFKSIEMVGAAYLAGEEQVLNDVRAGKEMYKVAASNIFNKNYDDINKGERQTGKVGELSLTYAGGIGAYAVMAKAYDIDLESLIPFVLPTITEDERYIGNRAVHAYMRINPKAMSFNAAMCCDVIKQRWRRSRPAITAFWAGLESAAYQAIANHGKVFAYRAIKFACNAGFLKCQLPSGRVLHYFLPKVQSVKRKVKDTEGHPATCMCDECITWDEAITYMGMKTVEGKTTTQWTRLSTYGGKFCENITQAFCRDLLAHGMLRLEDKGYPICLHVHDEAVSERLIGEGNLDEFCNILAEVPDWAAGMPIEADGWKGKRYRK